MSEVEKVAVLTLADLASTAVANNYVRSSSNGTPIFELAIEDARGKVLVQNANKKQVEGEPEALVLKFGQRVLPLDQIAPKAQRLNTVPANVVSVTELLLAEVAKGSFDAEIVACQAEIKKGREEAAVRAAEKAAQPKPTLEEATESQDTEGGEAASVFDETEAPAGVDLDALS